MTHTTVEASPFPIERCQVYDGKSLVKHIPGQIHVIIKSAPWDFAAAILSSGVPKLPVGVPFLLQISAMALRGRVGVACCRKDSLDILEEVFFHEEEGAQTKTMHIDDLERVEAVAFRGTLDEGDAMLLVTSISVVAPQTIITQINDDSLFAFYRCASKHGPADLLLFLASAEAQRRRQGLGGIFLHVAPATTDDSAHVAQIGSETIIGDVVSKFPSVQGYSWGDGAMRSPAPKHLFRNDAIDGGYDIVDLYELSRIHCAPPPDLGRQYVRQWISSNADGRQVITFTLRFEDHEATPASNLAAWGKIARNLDAAAYFPVLIPDPGCSFQALPPGLESIPTFPAATENLALRIALYEMAFLNLGSNNDLMSFCFLTPESRFIYFDCKGQSPTAPGYCLLSDNQRHLFEPDDEELIYREVKRMLGSVDSAQGRDHAN